MTQQFTYLFYDLMSGTKLAELPLQGVNFSAMLNGTGSFGATLNLTDARVKGQLGQLGGDQGSPLNEGKTAIYVDMDSEIIWGGILWTTAYDSGTKTATLGGMEFWSYFSQGRRIAWNADYSIGVDQLLIFKDIIDTVQLQTGGNIGVITSGTTPSGQSISIKWDASQLSQIGQAVSALTQQSGVRGFDFAIDVAYDVSKVPQKYLTLSYPRRGRIAGLNNVSFDASNKWAKPYKWPRDATSMANVVYGIGAGTGPATAANQGGLRSTQSFTGALLDGYPLMEGSLQRSDITDQATLDNLTLTHLASVAYPVVLPQLEFDLNMPDPQFGSYIIGDDAEIVIAPDEWFPNGYSEFKRIASWNVSVPSEGSATVKLNFVDPGLLL